MIEAYLLAVAVALMLFGASLAWPLAKRAGAREAATALRWEAVDTPLGRRWRPIYPAARPAAHRAARLGWRSTVALRFALARAGAR